MIVSIIYFQINIINLLKLNQFSLKKENLGFMVELLSDLFQYIFNIDI